MAKTLNELPNKARKRRIRDWKGLMAHERLRTKLIVFIALAMMSASATFVQFGFVGLDLDDKTYGYALTLLAPLAASALLLGKGWAFLEGGLIGSILYAHANFQPLDLYEKFFVGPVTSIVLYSVGGFILGLLFAVALHNNPRGIRRGIYVGIVCFVCAHLATIAFYMSVIAQLAVFHLATVAAGGEVSGATVTSISGIGNPLIQAILDFVLMFIACVVATTLYERYHSLHGEANIEATFGTLLFVVVMVSFMVLAGVSFTAITMECEGAACKDMLDEADYLIGQIGLVDERYAELRGNEEISALSGEALGSVYQAASAAFIMDGYDVEDDGTLVVFDEGKVVLSDDDAYPIDSTFEDIFGESEKTVVMRLDELAQNRSMLQTLYSRSSYADYMRPTFNTSLRDSREIGYMVAQKTGDTYVMVIRPAHMVFATRHTTMTWITLSVFVLLGVVYALVSRLLKTIVIAPINETNASLERITQGNLDERVDARENVEFASLSDGINTTVDALKGWIHEAETRMERDLATAKAIQESALPRTFPPFPEIEAFDIYASMNAAKEVGGDFYDFFLIDDHTLGFLIADVSGKGIPGALFMMTAKTELENYIQSGMALDQAVAGTNARLCANNDAGMFVTVWAATLNWKTGLLTYVNAGHNFPLLRHNGTWQWMRDKCGLFLGTFDIARYRAKTITLEPGDQIMLYTDGVNEAFNIDEKEYGNERLEAFLANHAKMHPKPLVEALRADVASWAQGAEQSDDITMLCLEYGMAPEARGSIELVATLENVEQAIGFVRAELDKRLCPLDVQHKIFVALEELVVNVCNYAYLNQPQPGVVRLSYVYSSNPSSIAVTLVDQGVPFNPLTRSDPTRPKSVQEARIGGLGIFMVKKTMDEFTYQYDKATQSNVVSFKKSW